MNRSQAIHQAVRYARHEVITYLGDTEINGKKVDMDAPNSDGNTAMWIAER
jgi:hypothetical protein